MYIYIFTYTYIYIYTGTHTKIYMRTQNTLQRIRDCIETRNIGEIQERKS